MVIQKLCYYAWAYAGALWGEKVCNETPLAWPSGPVFVELHEFYQPNDSRTSASAVPGAKLDDRTQSLVDGVFSLYGSYGSMSIMRLSRSELPWDEANGRSQDKPQPIDFDLTARYFRARMDAPADIEAYARRFASRYGEPGSKMLPAV